MGRTTIISVGDELLAGRLADSNATWLSQVLRREGFPVVRRETVGDREETIAEAVKRALGVSDLVVLSGGLGPTGDDLTREGIALALGCALEIHPQAEASIREFLGRHGRTMSAANRGQARLPTGASFLVNRRGTAPGIWAEEEGRMLAALPGVPVELEAMVEEELVPRLRLRREREAAPLTACLTVVGLAESEIGRRLADLMDRDRNPRLGSYPGIGEVRVLVEAQAKSTAEAQALLQKDLAEIRSRLGEACMGEGDVSLAGGVAAILLGRGLTVAVAESLTGGRVADRLISVPGISAVFLAGVVAYGNEQKRTLLGVNDEVLVRFGAVSAECARAMAEGVRRVTGAEVGLSTTGIAGPTGEVEGKPLGTVFAAVAGARGTTVERRQIAGDREQIRERSATFVLDLLRRQLLAGGPLDYPART